MNGNPVRTEQSTWPSRPTRPVGPPGSARSAGSDGSEELNFCSEELIHIPGAIQPHGMLFSIREKDLTILQVSENAFGILGISEEELIGAALSTLLAEKYLARVRQALSESNIEILNPFRVSLFRGKPEERYDAIFHRSDGVLILELETSSEGSENFHPDFYHSIRAALIGFQDAPTVLETSNRCAQEVSRITGFGRVMIYRFDSHWNGMVVAEKLDPEMSSYLGLHFPAADIPAQARALYAVNPLRIIPCRSYTPSPLVPALNPQTGAPLDLSYAVLRSVSPIHLEYLKNMGDCEAALSISIMQGDQLWGLIACHHRTPKYLAYSKRAACLVIGRILSEKIANVELGEEKRTRKTLRTHSRRLVQELRGQPDLVSVLKENTPDLLAVASAHGALIYHRGQICKLGMTPPTERLRDLIEWLPRAMTNQRLVTDRLGEIFPPAREFGSTGAGLLAVSTSETYETMILWFRPEVIETVYWAGDPRKIADEVRPDTRISPRKSFSLWAESVRLKSSSWCPPELEAVEELKNALVLEMLAQSHLLLTKKNQELDEFGYIVSHDLKEPLRGIRNYLSFASEDHRAYLETNPDLRKRIDQCLKLTKNMEDLLTNLHHYSRIGRHEGPESAVDLNRILATVVEALYFAIDEAGVELRIPKPLPTILCDGVRIGEVFYNLISNAVKYRSAERPPWVEIGFSEPAAGESMKKLGVFTFFVKDNGLGILERHHASVFRMFRRLHSKDRFGGGTGSGLAIVKRIVESQGGRVWLESSPEVGSAFYFTVPEKPEGAT